MKDLLKQAINAMINEDMVSAKKLYSQYFELKSKAILEKDGGYIHGHCDDCGEDSTTKQHIIDSKKWACGKCESQKFVASEKKPGVEKKKKEAEAA